METAYPIYFAITFSSRCFSFTMSYFSVFGNKKTTHPETGSLETLFCIKFCNQSPEYHPTSTYCNKKRSSDKFRQPMMIPILFFIKLHSAVTSSQSHSYCWNLRSVRCPPLPHAWKARPQLWMPDIPALNLRDHARIHHPHRYRIARFPFRKDQTIPERKIPVPAWFPSSSGIPDKFWNTAPNSLELLLIPAVPSAKDLAWSDQCNGSILPDSPV